MTGFFIKKFKSCNNLNNDGRFKVPIFVHKKERKYINFPEISYLKDGYGRTDFPESSPDDMNKSLERLKKLIKPGIMVFPGHDESFLASMNPVSAHKVGLVFGGMFAVFHAVWSLMVFN